MIRLGDWADQHGYKRATVYRAFRRGTLESRYGISARRAGRLIVVEQPRADEIADELRAGGYVVLTREQFEGEVRRIIRDCASLAGGNPSGETSGNPG